MLSQYWSRMAAKNGASNNRKPRGAGIEKIMAGDDSTARGRTFQICTFYAAAAPRMASIQCSRIDITVQLPKMPASRSGRRHLPQSLRQKSGTLRNHQRQESLSRIIAVLQQSTVTRFGLGVLKTRDSHSKNAGGERVV